MGNQILSQARKYLSKRKKRVRWHKVVSVMAAIVVFCTTYALILPAITQERDLICEIEEHTHVETCYEEEKTLICEVEENEGHAHDEKCYKGEQTLICTSVETEGHSHVEVCYTNEQILNCELEENEEHTHIEECYTEQQTLACTLEEAEAHAHSDACYEGEKTLVCTVEECEAHIHAEACYETENVMVCEKEEHTHEDTCYAASASDPTADVETQEEWEATMEDVVLTGDWSVDIVGIAESQLGYTESTKNYVETESGELKGYTRYGAWYGDPYGDWCAMFVSFCLNYAEVEGVPHNSNCANWIEELKTEEINLYREASSEYEPKAGDLIFFEWNDGDDTSDHVGIVAEMTPAEGEEPAKIKTIEGNASDKVKEKTYELSDSSIIGYGELPEVVLTEEEQAEVDTVIALIDKMPSADEIDAKLAEFEEAEDYEGEEGWYTKVCQQVVEAYQAYSELSDKQKAKVTNADKLMELEYIWSAVTYNGSITSVTPTKTWYTSTKDFVELNLYDYNGYVNANYWSKNDWYPGFQWNGGAYSNDSGDGDYNDYRMAYGYVGIGIPYAITDRNYIDSIDFGNSLITNLTYGGGLYGSYTKAVNSTNVVRTSSKYNETGPSNWIYGNSTEGYTNKPIGTSTTDLTQTQTVMQDTLVSGYPALADGTMLDYLFKDGTASVKMNTESIDGLFQKNEVTGEYSYNSRTNHAQYTNNFFQLYEEIITPNFITYPFGNFLPLNTISDSSKATQVGAFNKSGGMSQYVDQTITDLKNNTEGLDSMWSDTQAQLVTMLEEYKENWSVYPRTINGTNNNWTNLSPANAIRDYFWGDTDGAGDQPSSDTDFITQTFLNSLYNIDWDVQTNFFFGMEMKMNFMMPKEGMTGNDTNQDGESDYPMIFYFTGDDDVWVYIDEILTLDLSGIHRHVGGEIDFVNGLVHYYALDVENGGDVSSTPYKTYGFEEIFPADSLVTKTTTRPNDSSIASADADLRGTAIKTFKNYSTHAFNFYYTERGSGSSVCRLNFNFPLIKKNAITVTKENVADDKNVEILGNPDYYFNIVNSSNELFVGPNSVSGVSAYKILDSSGKYVVDENGDPVIKYTDEYGIFTLKAGQSAVFEGIKENLGTYFVQELIKEEDESQYNNIVTVNGLDSRYNKLIEWDYRDYFSDSDNDTYTGPYGYKWYGHSGYDTDASSNSSFYFEALNGVVTDNLGELSIKKDLTNFDGSTVSDRIFKMYVELDGSPLPEGTSYTVGDTTKEAIADVDGNVYIEIAAGETATISNILSGTQFEIWEASDSADGYTVIYDSNADEVSKENGSSISGVIRNSADVTVTVTNTESGATVTIPGTKTVKNPNGSLSAYEFQLQQVTDSTGSTIAQKEVTDEAGNTIMQDVEPQKATVTVSDGTAVPFDFTLTYLERDIGEFPAYFYYKITETIDETDLSTSYDDSTYIVEVEVSKDSTTGQISATVTNIWKNDTKIENIDISSSQTSPITFTNEQLYQLTIEKETGENVNTNEEFTFEISLSVNDVTLSGKCNFIKTAADDTTTSGELEFIDGKVTISLKSQESLTIYGLTYGTTWNVKETNATGYKVSYTVGTQESEEGNIAGGTLKAHTSVKFLNEATYELPETGSYGSYGYMFGGVIILLLAILEFVKRFARRCD